MTEGTPSPRPKLFNEGEDEAFFSLHWMTKGTPSSVSELFIEGDDEAMF